MIIFDNVTKIYDQIPVLNKLSFKIQGREFISIVGESGAGKTTIAKLLLGADIPTTGKVSVDGIVIHKMSQRILQLYRRQIGMIFQDYKLLPRRTVYENVAFALEVCGESSKEISKRVPEVLEIVNLVGNENKFPHQLSGGEQQRVSIARALIHKPRLLIADEPTGNLDPDNTEEIVNLLLKINELGTTVILTTHNREMVNNIKKRVLVLHNGHVISDKETGHYVQALSGKL